MKTDDSDDTTYIRGYNINYDSGSVGSTCQSTSTSDFMHLVFEKSVNTNSLPGPKSTSTPIPTKARAAEAPRARASLLLPSEVAKRCNVAIECRNNMICYEGNRGLQLKKDQTPAFVKK